MPTDAGVGPLRHHGDQDVVAGQVDLAVNVRTGSPPGWLRKRLVDEIDRLGSYPDPRAATRAVARRHGRDPAEALVTHGAAEAFVLLARALRPRHPVVVHPQFTEPEVALHDVGCVVDRAVLSAPFDLQVMERDEVIGASGSSRIMLAAGRHDVVLVNRALDYQEARRVEITAGQTAQVRIDPPKVSINVNARPWADVSIDGNEIGQTPISNTTVTVGTHQLVFRHPQLGERRQNVVVTAKGPNRVSVDLTK